jgi:hypothetical protein
MYSLSLGKSGFMYGLRQRREFEPVISGHVRAHVAALV